MGTILASLVASKAQIQIQDRSAVRWPMDELVGWLSSGQRQIVLIRPDACSSTELFQLAPGTKQSIPLGGLRLLNVIRNQGADGATPGRAIRFCQREILDSQLPDWHFANPSSEVKHFHYDDVEPRTWYCFPPQPTSGVGQALIVISRVPAPCTIVNVPKEDGTGNATATSTIALDDIYENSLIDYVIFRAQMKDADFAKSERAQLAWSMFMQGLGVKSSVDKAFAPVNNAPPRTNPNVPNPTGAFGA